MGGSRRGCEAVRDKLEHLRPEALALVEVPRRVQRSDHTDDTNGGFAKEALRLKFRGNKN